MTKGPQGQKHKADVVGNAMLIGRIAVGDEEDTQDNKLTHHHRESGKKDGAARAAALAPDQRSEIAKKATAKRWGPSS